MTAQFRVSPTQILPVLATLTLAGFITYGFRTSGAEVVTITVFPETPGGATLNASVFVIMMAVAATFIYLLLRYKRARTVKYLIATSVFFVTFFLLNWHSEPYGAQLAPVIDIYGYVWTAITATTSVLLLTAMYRGPKLIRLLSVIIVGSLTGTFLGVSIPTLTAMVLLVALALYDALSVYRGPIGRIAEIADLEEFKGAALTVGDLTIGMGDLVFYSMLVSNAMVNLGILAYVGAFAGVAFGSYLGLRMLERREIFPGLPISIGLGLAAMLVLVQFQMWFRL